jgi:hypothetical protein
MNRIIFFALMGSALGFTKSVAQITPGDAATWTLTCWTVGSGLFCGGVAWGISWATSRGYGHRISKLENRSCEEHRSTINVVLSEVSKVQTNHEEMFQRITNVEHILVLMATKAGLDVQSTRQGIGVGLSAIREGRKL